MSSELLHAIEQVSREKNIDQEVIISAVEDAIVAASKKMFKSSENFRARFNRTSGDLEVWTIKEVVDEVTHSKREITKDEAKLFYDNPEVGDQIEIMADTSKLGRIAAHAAKQVILQKVRDAEKENTFSEFANRVGEVITGVVRRFERGNVILDLGNNTEAIMYKEEQSRAERYSVNDRVRVVIIGADKSSKEPQVKVSRADARLLMKLFEMEVPEIYDGTVVLKNAAREAGDRSKIAVYSTDPDVDPIGACVGMGGARVKSIIRELKGERLDIVRYSDDVIQFAINALSPARINRVFMSETQPKTLEVIVDEDQLSLAIGKKGQNVRLASKLLGWAVEIKTEEQKRQEAQAQMERMAELAAQGIDEPVVAVPAVPEVESEPVEVEPVPMAPAAHEEEVVTAEMLEQAPEASEEAPGGVPLDYLEGLDPEYKRLLEVYGIYYIEDLLYTPREVLDEIPELREHMNLIVGLAQDYAGQFEE
ncbi:MAG: transcription termination/antitermination protein NusA [Acidobacteria bacterium]|nr:transcription termination/antitermination protein NusA [Acidobacteriota bacterium]MCB9398893.1 transcription termination/antitermination protein NusA [Acidobacteriota bacterium]